MEVSRGAIDYLLRNAWGSTAEERAGARLLVRSVTLAAVWVILVQMLGVVRRPWISPAEALVLLLPAALGLALPIACLLGVLVASQGRPPGELGLRSLTRIATLVGLATFVTLNWVTPETNQSFRQALRLSESTGEPLVRGDREMSVSELAARAATLHAAERPVTAAGFEFELHKKPALGVWCLALAIAGGAIVRWMRTPALRWIAALGAWWIWLALLRLGEQAVDAGRVPAAFGMWAPVLTTAALAAAAFWGGRERSASPADLAAVRPRVD